MVLKAPSMSNCAWEEALEDYLKPFEVDVAKFETTSIGGPLKRSCCSIII